MKEAAMDELDDVAMVTLTEDNLPKVCEALNFRLVGQVYELITVFSGRTTGNSELDWLMPQLFNPRLSAGSLQVAQRFILALLADTGVQWSVDYPDPIGVAIDAPAMVAYGFDYHFVCRAHYQPITGLGLGFNRGSRHGLAYRIRDGAIVSLLGEGIIRLVGRDGSGRAHATTLMPAFSF